MCLGKKSLGEGAVDKKAKPAKQSSLDSNGSSNGSGDERKESSSEGAGTLDDAGTSNDASKQKEVSCTLHNQCSYYT